MPDHAQELIEICQGIYKQWMDCEGTEWRGDSDGGSDDGYDAGSGIGTSDEDFNEGFTDKYASSDSPIDTAWLVLKGNISNPHFRIPESSDWAPGADWGPQGPTDEKMPPPEIDEQDVVGIEQRNPTLSRQESSVRSTDPYDYELNAPMVPPSRSWGEKAVDKVKGAFAGTKFAPRDLKTQNVPYVAPRNDGTSFRTVQKPKEIKDYNQQMLAWGRADAANEEAEFEGLGSQMFPENFSAQDNEPPNPLVEKSTSSFNTAWSVLKAQRWFSWL